MRCGAKVEAGCPGCGKANVAEAAFCISCGTKLTPASATAPTPTPHPSPALPASFADGRYEVKGFLGEGGRKRVYLTHDRKLDRDVAFAVIKTDGLDADGLERVQREAQAMGRLGDHPNIVTVFDTGDDAGAPYIVSQYMGGGDLAFALRNRTDRYPIDVVLRVADQVCAGLEHAHSKGIVHRDLKPGNIWFDSSAVAKIGDFGLAVALDRSRLTVAGMMVGTASYMPPEQAMGGETTPSSDLYALGCVLYEMVTGRPPFVGDDTVGVISQHVNTAPVSPTWHNADCPPVLEALIMRLLEKDRKQRPPNATEVREVLASIGRGSTPVPQAAAVAPPAAEHANPIYRRTFVGREQELKQLENAFDKALSGQGSLVMIVGEPGIGKTTTTEQLGTYVGMRGGSTLLGHCYEEGSLSLPYLPFVEAIRAHVLDHDREQLSQELGQGAADVARIVSEVRDRINVVPASSGSPEEERFRLFQAVATFLRNASAKQPLCIILEDLHDADKGTMEMLVHLGRNLGGARLLLVGTYRDVEVDRTHPLSAALAELRRSESFARIPLRGLSPTEVQRMLSNIAGQEIPFELGEAVYRQTEGNPLFIQEVIRYAAESGLIKREGGLWVAEGGPESLLNQIPEGLRDVIGRRLSGLSDQCNKVLSIASVIGRDFAVDVLRRVAGVSEDELLTALEEATRVSLIEEMRGQRELRYRFTHAFFRQTLYEEMIAPRRLRMHNEVAKALEQHYEGRLEEHAAELAEHFSHSSTEEDLRKAVQYGRLAAGRASSVFAYSEAVRYLDQAIEVLEVLDPTESETRLELMIELQTQLLSAGESERILNDVGKRAFDLAVSLGGGTRAARVADTNGWAFIYQHGSLAFTMPAYREWCEQQDVHAEPGSRERAIADCNLSWPLWFTKQQEKCWELRRRALDLARTIGDPYALAYATYCFMLQGGPQRWDAERLEIAREVQGSSRAGLPPNVQSQLLFSLAMLFSNAGDRQAAERSWDELASYAAQVPDPYAQSWDVGQRCIVLRMRGELEESLALAADFQARAVSLGIELWGRFLTVVCTTDSMECLGRYEELAAAHGPWLTLPYGESIVAHYLAVEGRIDEAQKELHRIIRDRKIRESTDWVEDVTLNNLLYVAETVGDLESVALLYERMKGTDAWYIGGGKSNGRAMGIAATLLGDAAAGRRHLEAALDTCTRIGTRPEVAYIRLELARLLFGHFPDEKRAAGEHLNFATQEAQAMKMRPLLDDCLALKLRSQGITSSTDIYTSIDRVASAVESQHPDLKTHAAPDGTVTIMFSDIEGSTEKTDRLGDKAWMDVLREHNAIVREHLGAFGGFEVKSEGDGFMVAFQSAGKAVECAMAIQTALAERNKTATEPVRVRMGLHAGEVIKEGEDFFGRNVIMAARVASQANGGEILASSVVRALLAGSDISWSNPRMLVLKGLTGEHEIWAVGMAR